MDNCSIDNELDVGLRQLVSSFYGELQHHNADMFKEAAKNVNLQPMVWKVAHAGVTRRLH